MEDIRPLAQAVLDAYTALRTLDDAEPELDDEGMPYDGAAWLVWYEQRRQPAALTFTDALRRYRERKPWTGVGTGSHPFVLLPELEKVLS